MKILRTHPSDEFINWSGSLRFTPRSRLWPANEADLGAHVRDAATRAQTLRVAGSGHSSSPLVRTPDLLVTMENFRGLMDYDRERCEAVIGAGTHLHDLGRLLHEIGLGMENLGDVDTQTLAGVISTGTHGSGRELPNISAHVIGLRVVTGAGEVVEWSAESQPESLRAARVSLGLLGVFTAIRMKLQPAFQLRRREYCAGIDECLANLDALAAGHRNFDFYWYPRRDEVKIRTLHPPDEPIMELPFAQLLNERIGFSHEVIARERTLKFDEVEYFVPAEAGPACFREVRRRVLDRHRRNVGWRVLYRLIAADDAYLSPVHGRDSVAISLHQNAVLPFQEYFDDIEPILRAHDGRPHWGKKHSMRGEQLAMLYPRWDQFLQLRRQLDPTDVFLSPDLAQLLGEERRG